MKKIIFILFAFSLLSINNSNASEHFKTHQRKATNKEIVVYVCNNGKTFVFHSSTSCSALNRCTHGVLKMTENEARKNGLRQCKKC